MDYIQPIHCDGDLNLLWRKEVAEVWVNWHNHISRYTGWFSQRTTIPPIMMGSFAQPIKLDM
jgi:hypothetical protein